MRYPRLVCLIFSCSLLLLTSCASEPGKGTPDESEVLSTFDNGKTRKEALYWDLSDSESMLRLNWYYESGTLKAYQYFKVSGPPPRLDDYLSMGSMAEGESVSYNENGQMTRRTLFKNGKEIGPQEDWLDDGKKWRVIHFNEEGDFFGEWINWYPDGTVEQRKDYKAGEGNIEIEKYYPNGQLKEKGEQKNWKWDGPYESYYENGNVKRKGVYDRGEMTEGFMELDERGRDNSPFALQARELASRIMWAYLAEEFMDDPFRFEPTPQNIKLNFGFVFENPDPERDQFQLLHYKGKGNRSESDIQMWDYNYYLPAGERTWSYYAYNLESRAFDLDRELRIGVSREKFWQAFDAPEDIWGFWVAETGYNQEGVIDKEEIIEQMEVLMQEDHLEGAYADKAYWIDFSGDKLSRLGMEGPALEIEEDAYWE